MTCYFEINVFSKKKTQNYVQSDYAFIQSFTRLESSWKIPFVRKRLKKLF